MKMIIPKYFEDNKLLNTLDDVSYAKYIAYKPLHKQEVTLLNNTLIFVQKGTKVLHFNNENKIINQGDIVLVKSGTYLMSEVLEDELYEALVFFFTENLLSDLIKKYEITIKDKEHECENFFLIENNPYLQNSLLSTLIYFENKNLDNNLLKLKLEEIFLHLINSNKNFVDFLANVHKSSNLEFKNFVEMNYKDLNTISSLAKEFKLSELNFRNKFKEVFSSTPKKWILKQKLIKAKLLLENSELNVSEICQEVGFESLSWFIQSYKKEFGQTPKKQKLTKIK